MFRSNSESGNATLVVAGVVTAVGLLFVASLSVARAAIERSEAQSAADAVALAGAGGDRADADRVAKANKVTVTAFADSDTAVEVTVRRLEGDQAASARAERGEMVRPVTIDVWVPIPDAPPDALANALPDGSPQVR
jgi:Putative Flp pilus-assembly TadE/G-like